MLRELDEYCGCLFSLAQGRLFASCCGDRGEEAVWLMCSSSSPSNSLPWCPVQGLQPHPCVLGFSQRGLSGFPL